MTVPDSHADILDKPGFAHAATIGPDGEPQNNPVWFDWDGETLRISQLKVRQKYKNLQQDPRIALSILDPENPYRYLEVRGEVVEIEDDPDYGFANYLAKKYMDQDEYPFHQPGDERIIVKIRPVKTSSMG